MDPYRYGNSLTRQVSGLWRSFRDGDFEEEDVWGVLRERKDSSSNFENSTQSSSFSVPRKIPTPAAAARMVPRMSSSNYSSSSNSPHEHNKVVVVQQSAPVKIPDWSKISGKNSKINASKNVNSWLDHDHDQDCDVDGGGGGGGGLYDDDDDDDVDNEYNDKIPPHEFIARRLASSRISSFSVFEGVGRTLKGRDLSKVRNAVLTKTGFLE